MILLPCPFCGSSRVAVRFYNKPSVMCELCGAFGPSGPLLKMHNMEECKEEASKLWNERVHLTTNTEKTV